MIFPILLLLIFCLVEIGLWYSVRTRVIAAGEEALVLYTHLREKGLSRGEAEGLSDDYLAEELADLTGEEVFWTWEAKDGFLREETVLRIEGSYRMVISLSYRIAEIKEGMDARRFKDRVDYLCEQMEKRK